jgi:hypothetical protein
MDTSIRTYECTSPQNYALDLHESPKNCYSQRPAVLGAEISVPAPLSPVKQRFSPEGSFPELFAGYVKDLEGKHLMGNEPMIPRELTKIIRMESISSENTLSGLCVSRH